MPELLVVSLMPKIFFLLDVDLFMVNEIPQLNLKLLSKLVYSAEGFLSHHGVTSVRESIIAGVNNGKWVCAFVYGPKRSGKTHLSIRLAFDLTHSGLDPRIISSNEINDPLCLQDVSSKTVFLVDEFEEYSPKSNSGAFVRFFEEVKNKKGCIILFSSAVPSELPFDEHIMSRVNASTRFEIDHPSEEDVKELLLRLALQRGLRLQDKKLNFATSRVRRDISSLEMFVQRVKDISLKSGEKIKFQTLSAAT